MTVTDKDLQRLIADEMRKFVEEHKDKIIKRAQERLREAKRETQEAEKKDA